MYHSFLFILLKEISCFYFLSIMNKAAVKHSQTGFYADTGFQINWVINT